ncbi:hypothetical protein [Micromonospora sp. NBC_00858]|nr:hypothetical protein OG990_04695 [Micromonospora sp. NBC_00858]
MVTILAAEQVLHRFEVRTGLVGKPLARLFADPTCTPRPPID